MEFATVSSLYGNNNGRVDAYGRSRSDCRMRGRRSKSTLRTHCQSRIATGLCESRKLFAQAKLFDQRPIAVGIARLQIVEQLAAPRHHPQQAAPRVVVLRMILEMIGKTVDACRQKRDLNFRGTGVAARALMLRDDLRFFVNRYAHAHHLSSISFSCLSSVDSLLPLSCLSLSRCIVAGEPIIISRK